MLIKAGRILEAVLLPAAALYMVLQLARWALVDFKIVG